MVEDYSYVGSNFRGDPYLPLPECDLWDDKGEKNTIPCVFFMLYSIFCILGHTETYHVIRHT